MNYNYYNPRPIYYNPYNKFNQMDKNGDGVVTPGEAALYLLEQNAKYGTNYNAHHLHRFFQRADLNRNGYVDLAEYAYAAQDPFF